VVLNSILKYKIRNMLVIASCFFLLGPLKRAVSFSIRTIMKKKLYLLPHCLCIRALVWNIKINHNVIVDAVIVNAWQKMWNHRKFELLAPKVYCHIFEGHYRSKASQPPLQQPNPHKYQWWTIWHQITIPRWLL
jgi:hypothetical protein